MLDVGTKVSVTTKLLFLDVFLWFPKVHQCREVRVSHHNLVLQRDLCKQGFEKPSSGWRSSVLVIISPRRNAEFNKCSFVVALTLQKRKECSCISTDDDTSLFQILAFQCDRSFVKSLLHYYYRERGDLCRPGTLPSSSLRVSCC